MSIQPLKRPPEASGSLEEQLEDIRTYLNILYRKVMTAGDEAVEGVRALYQSITEGNNPELLDLFGKTITAEKIIVQDNLTDGKTVIDGGNILTGTIDADRIDVGDIIVDNNLVVKNDLTDGVTQISGSNITTGTVDADYLDVTGIIQAGTVVVKNDLVDGTTIIDGGNILTGTVSADRLSGNGLDVKNANIENCTINNQCTINAPIKANTVASNTDGSYTGTLTFGSSGYNMTQNYGSNSARVSANATSARSQVQLEATDEGATASLTLRQTSSAASIALVADDLTLNGSPIYDATKLKYYCVLRPFTFNNAPTAPLSSYVYDCRFISGEYGTDYTGISISPTKIQYRLPNNGLVDAYVFGTGWTYDDYKTIYLTWAEHNPTGYQYLIGNGNFA